MARVGVKACFFAFAALAVAQNNTDDSLKRLQSDLSAGRYATVIENGSSAAERFRRAGDYTSESRALSVTGLAQLYSGAYQPALETFSHALSLSRSRNDFDAEVTALNNIGTVFYFEGHYSQALDRYQEAMRRAESALTGELSDSRRELTTANIAILYQTVGQFDRALDLYTGLLNRPRALKAEEEAQLLTNAGALRRRLGDPAKALETYRAAQAIYRQTAHLDGEIAVLNNIGILQAMDLHDFEAAVVTFTSALKLAQQSGDRPLAVQARLYRGEAYFRAGSSNESQSDFRQAAEEAGELGEAEEHWKALYGLARLAEKIGASNAKSLLQQATADIESLRAGLGGSSLRSDFLADKRDVYDLLIEHTSATGDVFRLMEQSRARDLSDRMRVAKAPDLTAVAQRLPASTALLEYWLGSGSSAVLWVTRSQNGIMRRKLTAADEAAIENLPAILSDVRKTDWRVSASKVANVLLQGIPPLNGQDIQRLIIVPDGALARIPFEVLPLAGSGLLVEKFSISYLPSAGLTSDATSRRVRWPWQLTFAGIADPSPGAPNAPDLGDTPLWSPLPESDREIGGAARLVGGASSLHTGHDARRDYITRGPVPLILQLATHAFADPQDPRRSFILFAPGSTSQRFDHLYLKEVYRLPLDGVDLAVLSACQTGAGKLVQGEGVESFSRAFLAAGARSVITSLWSVGDRSTAELMLRFFGRLANGENKADALREAKLQFLQLPQACHPAYWASFILSGDGESRIPYIVSWKWLAAPALLMIFAFALLRMRARKA